MSQQASTLDRFREQQVRAKQCILTLSRKIESLEDQHKKDLQTIDELLVQIERDRLIFAGIDRLKEAKDKVRK